MVSVGRAAELRDPPADRRRDAESALALCLLEPPGGMPGPSSRTVTWTSPAEASSSTHAGAVRTDVGHDVVEAGRDHGDDLVGHRPSRSTPSDGAATDTPGRRSSADSAPTRSTTAGVGSTASCWRISDRSAVSCSPASRPSSAPSGAEVGPAALHQRRAPAARRRARRGRAGCAPRRPPRLTLGGGRPRRRAQQRVDHQADDRAADRGAGRGSRRWSRTGSAGSAKSSTDSSDRGDQRRPARRQWIGPGEHRRHHPEARAPSSGSRAP